MLLFLFSLSRAQLTIRTASITPNTVLTDALFRVQYSYPASAVIPANANLVITFPSAFLSDAPTNCRFQFNSGVSTPCFFSYAKLASSTTYALTFTGLFTSGSPSVLAVTFNKLSPSVSGNTLLSYSVQSNGVTITSLASNFAITAQTIQLAGITITSSSQITGDSAVFTVSIDPAVQIVSNSQLTLLFPTYSLMTSNLQSPLTNSISSISCSSTLGPYSISECQGQLDQNNFQNIVVVGVFTTTQKSPFSFQILGAKNPFSLQPITVNAFIIFNSRNVQLGSATLQVTQAAPLTYMTLSTNSEKISQQTTGMISFINTNIIPSKDRLAAITIEYDQTAITLVYQPPSSSFIVTVSTGKIKIQGITNYVAGQGVSLQTFSVTNPPSSQPVTLTIKTYSVKSDQLFLIDSGSFTYAATPSIISVASLSHSSRLTYRQQSLTLKFTTVNKLISGSFISVRAPNQFFLTSLTCQASGSLTGLTCSISSSQEMQITLTGVLPAQTQATLVLGIRNPAAQATTSSFSITTYYSSNALSVVDKLTSGLTFTAVADYFTSVSVLPSSFITGSINQYTFACNIPIAFQNSFVKIVFPSEVVLSAASSITSSTGTSGSPRIAVSGQTATITQLFTSTGQITINIKLNQVTNPSSLKPSSSFSLFLYDGSGALMFTSAPNSLKVTMAQAAILTASVTASGTTLAQSSCLFTIQTLFQLVSGQKVKLKFDSKLQIASATCSSAVSVTCSVLAKDLTLSLNANAASPFTFTVANILGYLSTSYTVGIQVLTNDNFLCQQGSASFLISPSAAIDFSSSSDNRIIVTSSSVFDLNIINPISLPNNYDSSLTKWVLTFPTAQFKLTKCQSLSTVLCTINTPQTLTLTSAGLFSSKASIQVTADLSFFSGDSSSLGISSFYNQQKVSERNTGAIIKTFCNSVCRSCTTPALCLTCFSSLYSNFILFQQNTCVSACDSNFYLSASTCFKCSSSCLTCSGPSQTDCLSCKNSYLHNQECKNVCPSGFFSNSGTFVCLPCNTGCTLCDNTKCYACSNGVLYQDQCMCPGQFVQEGVCVNSCSPAKVTISGVCTSCPTNCQKCSTSSVCVQCISPLILELSRCVTQCSGSSFSKDRVCLSCPIGCMACSSASLCSTCTLGYFFYQNICISKCPSGSYEDQQPVCLSCKEQCLTCSSGSSCLSCKSGLLSNGNCVQTCPDGTGTSDGKTCQSCKGCKSCEMGSCTSCYQSSILLNGKCYTICPSGQLAQNGACQSNYIYKVVYFPFFIGFIVLEAALVLVRLIASNTLLLTNSLAFLSLFSLFSTLLLLVFTVQDSQSYTAKGAITASLATSLGLLFIINFIFIFLWKTRLQNDPKYVRWSSYKQTGKVRWLLLFCSLLECKSFRLIYGRIYNLGEFSCRFSPQSEVLTVINIVSLTSMIIFNVLAGSAAAILLYNKKYLDQVFFAAIQTVLLHAFTSLLLLVDSYKQKSFFQEGIQRFGGVSEEIDVFKLEDQAGSNNQALLFTTGKKPAQPNQDSGAKLRADELSSFQLDKSIDSDREDERRKILDFDFKLKTQLHDYEEQDQNLRIMARVDGMSQIRLTQSMVTSKKLDQYHNRLVLQKNQYFGGKIPAFQPLQFIQPQLQKLNHVSQPQLQHLQSQLKLSKARSKLSNSSEKGADKFNHSPRRSSRSIQKSGRKGSKGSKGSLSPRLKSRREEVNRSQQRESRRSRRSKRSLEQLDQNQQGQQEKAEELKQVLSQEEQESQAFEKIKKRKKRRKREKEVVFDGQLKRIYMQRLVPAKASKAKPSQNLVDKNW